MTDQAAMQHPAAASQHAVAGVLGRGEAAAAVTDAPVYVVKVLGRQRLRIGDQFFEPGAVVRGLSLKSVMRLFGRGVVAPADPATARDLELAMLLRQVLPAVEPE